MNVRGTFKGWNLEEDMMAGPSVKVQFPGTAITIPRLKKRLCESLLDAYFKHYPSLCEPPKEPVP
jgi:hypothetical protein